MNTCCLLLAVRIPNVLGALAIVAAALLFYVYIGYPLLLAILGIFFRRPRMKTGYTPSITVLIAAYNEETAIGRKIGETLALEYPGDKLEILVVSDGSTDRTDEIVESVADPRVRLLRMTARGGKTNGQNEGVKHCRKNLHMLRLQMRNAAQEVGVEREDHAGDDARRPVVRPRPDDQAHRPSAQREAGDQQESIRQHR